MEEVEQSFKKIKLYDNFYNRDAIFTRYLFIKKNCYWTLLLNIINKYKNESLYWAYELYYSGFEKEIIMFIYHIFNIFYINTTNISFKNIIEEKINIWFDTNDETILGTLIYNICNKNADISNFFVKNNYIKYNLNVFNIQYEETDTGFNLLNNKKYKKHLFVNMTQIDIMKYKDIDCNNPNYRPRYVLDLVTKYRCEGIKQDMFNSINNYNESTEYVKNLITDIHNKEYYIEIIKTTNKLLVELYFTPIWNKRLLKYNAKLVSNYKKGNPIINGVAISDIKLEFPNDELYEDFCNLYWYEPDENLNGYIASRF